MKETLASYLPERMMIRIGPELHLLDDQGNPTPLLTAEAAGIFFHEYAHFLHNISTISGISILINTIELWRRFRVTHHTTGYCNGSDGQSAIDQRDLKQLLKHIYAMRHNNNPELEVIVNPVTINIRSYVSHPSAWFNGKVLATELTYVAKLEDDHGGTEVVEGTIGTLELLESAAWLLEKRIVQALDPSAEAKRPPVFPYLVVEEFCKTKAPDIDDEGVLACILSALQSSDATSAITEVLAVFTKAVSDDENAAEAVGSCTTMALQQNLPKLDRVLVELEEEFGGEGIMAMAIQRIVKAARRALELRAERPFFELDWIKEVGNGNMCLNDIMKRIPSCGVLQVNHGSQDKLKRDFLLSFLAPSTDSVYDPEAGFMVVHSIFDYLNRHVGVNGFVPTNNAAQRPCPFYTTCDLSLRRSAPEICKNTPWTSSDWTSWDERGVCWYGIGVRVTRQPKSVGVHGGAQSRC